MLEIYKTDSEHKEYIEGLLELLSQEGMGEPVNVLQMVLYDNGNVSIDAGRYSMQELMLFKGYLELSITHRYLLRNGCGAMLVAEEYEECDREDVEEDTDGE